MTHPVAFDLQGLKAQMCLAFDLRGGRSNFILWYGMACDESSSFGMYFLRGLMGPT